MISYDNLTKSFHKHLYENVQLGGGYYCHFSKQSLKIPYWEQYPTDVSPNSDRGFTKKVFIQPIWSQVHIYPVCPNIIKMTLKCQSVIDEDPLLSDLRILVDYVNSIYNSKSRNVNEPDTNLIPLYLWEGITPTATGKSAYTITKDIYEIPVTPFDTIASVNVNLMILVCC